jgi:succinate dehydrogenase/fumarate reductase flavoprotein subunit
MNNYVTVKRDLDAIKEKFKEIEDHLERTKASICVKQLIKELKDLVV